MKVSEIRKGDTFPHPETGELIWTAVADASVGSDGTVSLKVQHSPDGGMGYRHWDDPNHDLEMVRP